MPAPATEPAPKSKKPPVTETTHELSGKTDTKPARPWPKGGRPSKAQLMALYRDETQAFDSIRDKWSYISHKLADQALEAARNPKKIDGRSLVALTTSAGIAYDKRWSKQTSAEQEVAFPLPLTNSIYAKVLNANNSPAMSQDRTLLCSACKCKIEPEQAEPIDPELTNPSP